MNNQKAAVLWLLQRFTAVLLLILLALHLGHVHYKEMGEPILFKEVAHHLKNILTLTVDALLLFLGLFHGLNGVRAVLLDYGFLEKYERLISWLLVMVGLIFFFWGVCGLWAFINIKF